MSELSFGPELLDDSVQDNWTIFATYRTPRSPLWTSEIDVMHFIGDSTLQMGRTANQEIWLEFSRDGMTERRAVLSAIDIGYAAFKAGGFATARLVDMSLTPQIEVEMSQALQHPLVVRNVTEVAKPIEKQLRRFDRLMRSNIGADQL